MHRATPADDQALQWLQRRHAGPWDADDQAELDAWLAADPDHAQAWAEAQRLWDDLAPLNTRAHERLARNPHLANPPQGQAEGGSTAGVPARPDSRPMTPPASNSRAGRPPPSRVADRPPPRPALVPWRHALTVLGIAALGGLLWQALPGAWEADRLLETGAGERRSVELADGSRVELAPRTRLLVQTSLACRCFTLQAGEVVFSVHHGDLRPLRVSAGLATVEDIGTVFWMRRDGEGVALAVEEGEVEAWAGTGNRPGEARSRLQAGQAWAIGAHGQTLPSPLNPTGDLMAWRRGEIVLRDAPLATVLHELQRHHPSLQLELDQRLAAYHLSGRLAAADLDAAWRLIERAYPARVQRLSPEHVRIEFQGR